MSTLARALSLISAIFMLTACGGGGSAVSRDNTDNGSGDDGTTTPTYSIALTLENESGASDNNLSENNSLFAVATVTDDQGNPYSDALLTFTLSNDELAEFGNDTGTARTNSSGVARIRLNASTASGDGEITAALSSGETGSTTFSATAVTSTDPDSLVISLVLQNEAGEIDNSLTEDNSLFAIATVSDQNGSPVSDALLAFTLSNDELAEFGNDTGTERTDNNGEARIRLNASTASGGGEITATLGTGETATTTFSATAISGTDPTTISVSLSLQNENGEPDNNLSEDNSLFAVATVTDQNGNPFTDALLTYSLSNNALAEFGNDTGTARTNSQGVAQLRLNASTASGDGEVTATLATGESGSTTFTAVAVTTEPTTINVALSLQNESGEADNNLSSSNALTAVATVTNSLGEPQADLLLTFSLSNDDLATFSNDTATALTNTEGVATIGMSVGSASGDGEVTATLATGETDSTTFSSEGSTTVSEEPASLELFADSIQLASSGSDEVELIALVKNEQSVLMEGVEVSFSAATGDGVELQLTQPETAADGTARAVLTSQNDKSNRTITITAGAGSLTESVDITIRGTEVIINGASSVILNDTVDYTIRLQDSDGQPIDNEDVVLSAINGTLSSTTVNTGTNGQATVSYTASSSGEDTITASALNAETSFTVQVQQDEFNFVNLPTEEVPLGQAQTITVQWRQNNTPVVGQEVTFSASRGVIDGNSTVQTDAEGQASIDISANNAGISSITATASDGSGNVLVSALTQIEFIATTPATIIADATLDNLGPDGQTSTISAVVRDANNNLVKNSVVNFTVSDVSTGFVSPSQATTDSKGIATTVFTSGSVSSNEAVIITASIADDESISDEVALTVGARAFDIVIGTGNEIETPSTTSYLKKFAVFVSDSSGRPVSNVNLTASVNPVKYNEDGVYWKGRWVYNDVDSIWNVVDVFECENEDENDNGILDEGEDTNKDQQLTPGIVGTVTLSNNGVTDENGFAELEYRYPESYAVWYFAEITVFGQSTGSEAQASMKYQLEILADDITDEGRSPPANPFGTGECPVEEPLP